MPYDLPIFRVTMVFTLPGGEVANAGHSWVADGTAPNINAFADEMADRCAAFWAAIDDRYSDSVAYIGIRVALIGTDGVTIQSAERFDTPNPGTEASYALPAEVAMVVSLRTGLSGASHRGRFYLPNPALGVMNDAGRFNSSTTNVVSTAAAALLGDIDVGGSGLHSVVASATTGDLQEILWVAVGDVPDVQRRRRSDLLEVYAVTPVA